MKFGFILIGLLACKQVAAQQQPLAAFPLQRVRLLDGPFKKAQDADMQYMLSLNPDRLLAPYLREAGLTPKAESYGNWENTGLDGHIGGHYLSALSNMFAATGKPEIKQRLDYMINQLALCQQANGDGYIAGIPGGKAMWQDVAAGKIKAGSFSLNDKWVPWYNIHKLYAGLYDAYVIAGNEQAKGMLLQLCNWCVNLTAHLSDDQVQQMLRSEHGGMNEVFANVAALTGDNKYLVMARRFSDKRILAPLLQQKDSLTGIHANTQIPKVIGYKAVAEVAEDSTWANAANFFWQTVVHNRTVSIGGNSVREHFHPANDFSSMIESREGPETCNSYNMLKLTRRLFLSQPAVAYMDYYERTLYNHILASENPNGGFVYFTPMRPNHYRVYSKPQEGFWCCVGSGLENHGKYGELIYAHTANDLYVNLFMASTLDWKEKGVTVMQQTRFPLEEATNLKLTVAKPASFAVYLRSPSWVTKGQLQVLVNQKPVEAVADNNGYIAVRKTWQTGDVITVRLPMHTITEFLPDSSNWVSFVHGPIVLSAATDTTGLQGLFADGSRMGHVAGGPLRPLDDAPMVVAAKDQLDMALVPGKQPLTYTAPAIFYQPAAKKLVLQPFYTIHNSRYVIYFPYTQPALLDSIRKVMQEKEQAKLSLDAITADLVNCGEQQPENDHGFAGENTDNGLFKEQHYRNAKGWFSYNLRNVGGKATKLRVTYYGKDKNRSFSIYVNGRLLSNVKPDGNGGDRFIAVDYPLPAEATNAAMLTVKFAAEPGSATVNIFEVRLLK
ncbi:hypothetical protein SAMN05421788_101856 [Filimonas lacunae]|uniref:Glycosyl hydrolase n=1 Tax=Filimonas lacunae TaxID=477680 RepID=A0A173MPN4_9BACT|nr:glycoside hydrolase family 127 protein [Filimonas lacunae]BAV09419.1 glycosyl hydrolase of unknown function [Filimonas lacunae]SIS72811.1 hypothetical protein SAMN05421788_101856 [Filimonas lacunae]